MIIIGIEVYNAVMITAFCIGQLSPLFVYNLNIALIAAMAYGPTILRIFLGITDNKGIGHKAKRLVVLSSLFRIFDWSMVMVGFTITAAMKEIGCPDLWIFLLLWVGYTVQSRMEIFASDHFPEDDITLMKGIRRLVDGLMRESRIWGIAAEFTAFIRIMLSDGVGCMAIYYRPCLPISRISQIVLLIFAAGLHMAIWFALYLKGYDGILPLLRDVIHLIRQ